MYTRNYPREDVALNIPESYSGTALAPEREPTPCREDGCAEDCSAYSARQGEEIHTSAEPTRSGAAQAGSFISRLPFGNFLGNIFNFDTFGLQKIGSEEILIIAVAAFLFFSRSGDKECALMLMLLLFMP